MTVTQTKLELILELQNKLKPGFASAKSEINKEMGSMQKKLSSVNNFFTPAMITGITAGAAAITAGFIKVTDKAGEFNSQFRELSNLNLDKSRSEIEDLRKLVLDTAWKKGFGANETTAAYNEVQSTVGLYGREAREIVEKQGEFANIFKANMGDWVAGTAKAMANWRFGVDRLDDFNKSAYATMQVGVVSFEELAKVQSVYAGAAASVNQDFDTANKLFSLFTVRTKSVDQAATQTKSLFNDLTKKSTIDAFKKVGINFYDSNKQLRQADEIMLDLNKKFMSMKNDQAIVQLKNQFKGSEGLIAMIQAATDKSGELKKTLDSFSDSGYDLDKARLSASNDILERQRKLTERIDNLMIRLGQFAMPIKEHAVNFVEWALKGKEDRKEEWKEKETKSVYDNFGHLTTKVKDMTEAEYNKTIDFISGRVKAYNDEYTRKSVEYVNKPFWNYPITSQGHDARLEFMDKKTVYERYADKYRADAWRNLQSEVINARENKDKTNLLPGSNNKTDKKEDDSTSNPLADSLTRVVGSASAPKNITVNIDSFNKGGINTQNTNLQKMDERQIEDWFTDMCMRVVANLETSYN